MRKFGREDAEKLRAINLEIEEKLSPFATRQSSAIREFGRRYSPELASTMYVGDLIRGDYSIDVDKIIHCPFYNRGNDKTQVFSFYHNDDITRRASHVQLVSRIARSIGKALRLNLDLIEAIAIGHDIGHTPFGHKGEEFLSELYYAGCGKYFNHNTHSVRALQQIANCNLTIQTLDGILCHCGEKAFEKYIPSPLPSFKDFYTTLQECYTIKDRVKKLRPSTLEGCVVRICDMIAYIGKDRQDAARLKLYKMQDFPPSILGISNPEIISNLQEDIIANSIGQPYIAMSNDVFHALTEIVRVNNELIYQSKEVALPYDEIVRPIMTILYSRFLDDLKNNDYSSVVFKHHYLNERIYYPYKRNKCELNEEALHDIVTDFIASMTDDYFVQIFKKLYPTHNLNSKIKYVEYFE